jgi:hypothetical protein
MNPTTAPIFRPGDYVRLREHYGSYRKGTEAVVESANYADLFPLVHIRPANSNRSFGVFPSRLEHVLAAWERELLASSTPLPSISEGDLVRAEKDGEIYQGRVREVRNGQTATFRPAARQYIGSHSGATIDALCARGFTVTVVEKVLPPLPTEPGFYGLVAEPTWNGAYHRTRDGVWSRVNGLTGESERAKPRERDRRDGLVRLTPGATS